jgi:uncharacterized protein
MNIKPKRFLFYLVHPAKFHFHKDQINELKRRGHKVDIIINTKEFLEELVEEEGWDYRNIFPKSRKIKNLQRYIGAFINLIKTIYRLWGLTKGTKYDLFIGDALVYLGRLKRIPALYPNDDVLKAVPEDIIWYYPANYIIAPMITSVGRFTHKKIGYKGNKALAHLHPNRFIPDKAKLLPELQSEVNYFLIRCTGFMATHDINRNGIDNNTLGEIVNILKPHGKIFITSERKLPEEYNEYTLNIKKSDISHYLYFAKMLISDSTTMSTEAAVLGTPSIEFDDYFHEIDQMLELQNKYELIHCFRTNEKEQFLNIIKELSPMHKLKGEYLIKRDKLLNNSIDISAFLVWFMENYPQSAIIMKKNPNYQDRFK